MGGFASILGHAATGYNEQANLQKQRDFLGEMEHRQQVHDLLMGVINNPNSTPEAINGAMGGLGDLHSTPGYKQYKFDPYKIGIISKPGMAPRSIHIPGLTAPAPPPGGSAQPTFSETSQPLPPGVSGPLQLGAPQMSMPQAPPGLLQATAGAGGGTVTTPLGGTQSLMYTPEQRAAQAASALGQATRAQAEQTMHSQIYTQPGGPTGPLTAQPINAAGEPMGPGIPNAVNPYQMQGRGLSRVGYTTPDDPNTVKYGTYNEFTREVTGQDGAVIPNAQMFQPSLVDKTRRTTESMDAAGNITRVSETGPTARGGKVTSIGGKPTATGGGQSAGVAVKPGSPFKLPTTPEDYQAIKDPITREAIDWATLGQKPTGNVQAVRQVEDRMNKMGLAKALPVPPALQRQIQQQFMGRNNAIGLIDDIQKNSGVLDSLISAGKIKMAINPGTGEAIITRSAGLTDKEEKLAEDWQQLSEHVNLLRGPLGATGFRSEAAYATLMAQAGNLMQDPRITRGVLAGMRERLVNLNSADKMVITGQGMNAAGANTAPPPPSSGMVTMKAPNGMTKPVPADQVEHYKSMGATVVQ